MTMKVLLSSVRILTIVRAAYNYGCMAHIKQIEHKYPMQIQWKWLYVPQKTRICSFWESEIQCVVSIIVNLSSCCEGSIKVKHSIAFTSRQVSQGEISCSRLTCRPSPCRTSFSVCTLHWTLSEFPPEMSTKADARSFFKLCANVGIVAIRNGAPNSKHSRNNENFASNFP